MDFKDLQPMGDFKMRLQYELERVKSVCEFDPKLSANEIDYYNNTILRLETVIEKAIFYLKTNEIKNTPEFKVIKRRLKNLNQKLFELRAEAEDNNVKLNIELLEFNEELIVEFLPKNPTYLDNHKEIEQEIRKFIKVDPEPIEVTKPVTVINTYSDIFKGPNPEKNYQIFKSFIDLEVSKSKSRYHVISYIFQKMKSEEEDRIYDMKHRTFVEKLEKYRILNKDCDYDFYDHYINNDSRFYPLKTATNEMFEKDYNKILGDTI